MFLESGKTVGEVIAFLHETYEIDGVQFLAELAEKELIEVTS